MGTRLLPSTDHSSWYYPRKHIHSDSFSRQELLHEVVKERGIPFHYGKKLVKIEEDSEKVTATFRCNYPSVFFANGLLVMVLNITVLS